MILLNVYEKGEKQHEQKNKHYIGAIRQEYIRDAQFYTGNSDEPFEDDLGWFDAEGDVIVWDGYSNSEEAVLNQLASLYECDKDRFVVYQIS